MNPELLGIYLEHLDKYSDELVVAAINTSIDCDQYFPRVSRLVSLCKELMPYEDPDARNRYVRAPVGGQKRIGGYCTGEDIEEIRLFKEALAKKVAEDCAAVGAEPNWIRKARHLLLKSDNSDGVGEGNRGFLNELARRAK